MTSSSIGPPLGSTRVDLESADPRRRLGALGVLSTICCASKPQQFAVGAFLRERTTGSASAAPHTRLLEIVLHDLQASDRTLRCAAARLVCQLASENLVNQESITQLGKAGFSVGWLHVFSVPPVYHTTAYESQSQHGRSAFLHEIVAGAYGDVYTQVSQYYASGCTSFLPLCWQFPGQSQRTDGDSLEEVPDPADHVLGFYLVPRQTQFPEPDEVYHDELQSLDASDRAKLQAVQTAFEQLPGDDQAQTAEKAVPAEAFFQHCSTTNADGGSPLRWVVDGESTIVPVDHDADELLTWSRLFVSCCARLHTSKLTEMFDSTTTTIVAALFQDLAFSSADAIAGCSFVWLPVLVAAILRHSDLPRAFKRHIQSLHRGQITLPSSPMREPWRVLLHTKLDQVIPVSWTVFLAQWRMAATMADQLKEQQCNVPQRRTSVCSVDNLRRSIVEHLQPHSFRDLDQLRRELPKISRLASHVDLNDSNSSARSLSMFREVTDPNDDDAQSERPNADRAGEAADPLAFNLALFHRMQHSMAELDALGLQHLQERQREKERTLETVTLNKLRAQDAADCARAEMNDKQRELEAKQVELEHRRAQMRATAHAEQQKRRLLAAQRKQHQDQELEERQQQLADKIQQRELQRVLCLRQRQQHEQERRPILIPIPTETKPSNEEPTRRPTVPAPAPTSKRPLSARASSRATDFKPELVSPEVRRQRALLYGKVVSKIYVAEALNRPPAETTEQSLLPPHQPHHLTRSFSVYRSSSFNVKAPVIKVMPPSSRRQLSPRHRRSLEHGIRRRFEEEAEQPVDEMNQDPDEVEDDDEQLQMRKTRASRPVAGSLSKPTARPFRGIHGAEENACSTLVMRNAAMAVSERIRIPDIRAPRVEDPSVPPYVIAAQYEALDEQYKLNFKRRFNLKNVSHRLSYDVLKQYTKMVRRDMAWQAFHDKCAGTSSAHAKVKYADFAAVAHSLGIALSEKKLLGVARQLDPQKSGTVEWKAFYTWWSMQYNTHTLNEPPTTPRR